nr:hypothetical protein [uncultured Draconibacterium sp.]
MKKLTIIIYFVSICSVNFGQELNKNENPFETLYGYLVELQESKSTNHNLLEKINIEFDKYLNLDRAEMDKFRFDDRAWDYAGYPFFDKLKSASQDSLSFNLFEFVLKIKPYYFATEEVGQGLSELAAEIAYLNIDSLLEYVLPMDSASRMEILMKPWWYAIPGDSMKIKLKDTDIKDEMDYVFKHSG